MNTSKICNGIINNRTKKMIYFYFNNTLSSQSTLDFEKNNNKTFTDSSRSKNRKTLTWGTMFLKESIILELLASW